MVRASLESPVEKLPGEIGSKVMILKSSGEFSRTDVYLYFGQPLPKTACLIYDLAN